jgi:Helicase HerA, central domain
MNLLKSRKQRPDRHADVPVDERVATPLIRPGLRLPHHRSTTRHLASVYPCHVDPGLGTSGILMGTDLTAGNTFHYDAFDLYSRGIITSPNMVILGLVGRGKSTVVKTLLYRSLGLLASPGGQPRFAVIADPKGEYAPLAEALGMTRLKLMPGGLTRLNPLDPGPRHGTTGDLSMRRTHMVTALAAGVLQRPLQQIEDATVGWAIDALTTNWDDRPTLADLIGLLANPTGDMTTRSGMTDRALVQDCRDVRLALEKLLDRSLKGMFDGKSTEQIDWHGRGIVIDLSGVTNTDAQPLVMIAATGWLQQLLAIPESETVPRRYQVMEEIWALLSNPHVARYYQACQKLSRTYGVANIAVSHRLEDFTAQTDDGTSTTKIGAGLVADTQTAVLFNLPPAQAAQAADVFGLPAGAAHRLTQLAKGEALWKIGDHLTIVQHHITTQEARLSDTDANLTSS